MEERNEDTPEGMENEELVTPPKENEDDASDLPNSESDEDTNVEETDSTDGAFFTWGCSVVLD